MTKQEFEEKYLNKFNEQQIAAIEAVYGPVLLLAVLPVNSARRRDPSRNPGTPRWPGDSRSRIPR